MRRTVFAFPRELLPAVWGSASARVAGQQLRHGRQGGRRPPASPTTALAWTDATSTCCVGLLADGPAHRRPGSANGSRRSTPGVTRGKVPTGRGRDRAVGCIITARRRPAPSSAGRNDGGWQLSRPRWTVDVATGWARTPRRCPRGRLRRAGRVPGCARSARAPRPTWRGGWAPPRPLSAAPWPTVEAVEVSLDGGATGWLLPDDVDDGGRPRRPGRRCSRRSTPPRWGGRSAASTSGRTPTGSSTATATPAPPPGGTAGSSAVWVPGRRRRGARRPGRGRGRAARAGPRRRGRRLTAWLDGDVVRSVYLSPHGPASTSHLSAEQGGTSLSGVREQPEQQAPPVQRLRIRYAKRGRLRFTSHRDFSRAFERALFRARIPMAYSSGFNPHPRISYAGAAPTGAASEAEYLEIGLAEVVDPAALAAGSTRRCPTASTCSRSSRPRGAAWPTGSRPAAGCSTSPASAADDAARAVETFLAPDAVAVRADDQEGPAHLRLPRGRARAHGRAVRRGGPARARAAARRSRPSVPTTSCPACTGSAGSRLAGAPLLTRLAQGPLDAADGDDRRPVIRLTVTGYRCSRVRYSTWSVVRLSPLRTTRRRSRRSRPVGLGTLESRSSPERDAARLSW